MLAIQLITKACALTFAMTLGVTADLAWATTLVGFHTDTSFVIAADSLGSFPKLPGEGEAPPPYSLCKVFEQDQAIFGLSGWLPVGEAGFAPKDLVAEVLTRRTSIRGAADEISKRLLPNFESWLTRRGANYVRDVIRQGDTKKEVFLIDVILGAFETSGPAAIAVSIRLPPGDPPKLEGVIRWSCLLPQTCPNDTWVVGEHKVIKYRAESSSLPSARTAADHAAALVQLEIDAGSPSVGPPIAVVEVTRFGVSWPRRGMCR